MAGDLNKKEVEKLTSSQLAAGSVRIPTGHVLVNEKYQGSVLVKVLKGILSCNFVLCFSMYSAEDKIRIIVFD